jgi:hypothetical protein
MAVFGKDTWLRGGEAFSVFFGILGRFAPTEGWVKNAADLQGVRRLRGKGGGLRELLRVLRQGSSRRARTRPAASRYRARLPGAAASWRPGLRHPHARRCRLRRSAGDPAVAQDLTAHPPKPDAGALRVAGVIPRRLSWLRKAQPSSLAGMGCVSGGLRPPTCTRSCQSRSPTR